MNLNDIINKNKAGVKKIIRMVTGSDNEDIEQEVYLKVWKNSHKYKEQGSFKSWINTIAKNLSKDYLKSAYKKHEQLIAEDDTAFENIKDKKASPELKLIKNDRHEKILNAINNLKPKFKEVIIYTEIYGYTYEECSKKFKCPTGTIKSRIYNAKKQLAQDLKDLL